MEEWQLGALLGLMTFAIIGLILRLEACHRAIIYGLERSKDDLVGAIHDKTNISVGETVIEMIRNEISDSIAEVTGNMRVPTAVDHLAGVFANVMQMREQWKIQKEAQELQANPLISDAFVPDEHGPTQNET
tara:strand:+ start:2331 stop:2726 length:396 start_codon:yes stop_codon:yes gene_type:complete